MSTYDDWKLAYPSHYDEPDCDDCETLDEHERHVEADERYEAEEAMFDMNAMAVAAAEEIAAEVVRLRRQKVDLVEALQVARVFVADTVRAERGSTIAIIDDAIAKVRE